MRSIITITAALSLLQLTSAQPHRRHAVHNAAHAKKDVVTVVNTVIAEESAAPLVVVVVDASGVPVSTMTESAVATPISTQTATTQTATSLNSTMNATSSSTLISSTSSSAVTTLQAAYYEAAPASSVEEVPAASADPVPSSVSSYVPIVAASSSSSAPATSSSASSASTGNGYGFTYGPYTSDGGCKDASAVLQDLKAAASGYSVIRTYGTDCSTVENVLAACKELGLSLFAGVYDINSLTSELDSIVSAANGDWSNFYGVAIGNELVNSGTADVGTVTAAISSARSTLRSAGFEGPVGTVDTLVATRSNPDLCNESDVCWMNSHPFFDGYTLPSAAGTFLTTQIATVKAVLNDSSKKIVITETGWPSKGSTNNEAVPSSENQATAISAIKSAFESDPSGVILFNVYNMLWKTSSASQYDAEQWWGFLGDAPSG